MDYLRRDSAHCHLVLPQIFTGAVPFNNSPPAAAMLAIIDGRRPPRPTHSIFTEKLWILMQRCWNQAPYLRPEASGVLKVLSGS